MIPVASRASIPIRPAPPPSAATLLASVPHRFFFLAGMAVLGLASLWWLWTLAARAFPLPPPPVGATPTALHAYLMLYVFPALNMFGFLFTAGPRWLDVAPPPAKAWRMPGLVAAAGALLLVPAQAGPAWTTSVAAGLFALGWAWLLLRFLMLLRASRVADRVHARLVAAALTMGLAGSVTFAAAGTAWHPALKTIGLFGFLLPVFVVVCHRMIPFFTASALPFVVAFRPGWLLAAMVGAPVLHGVLELSGAGSWTWLVDLPAAALLGWLALRWGLAQSLANRLLAMLHLGFVWYAIAFAIAGAHALAQLLGAAGFGLAALHAFTVGFATSLVMAMVTRVTCGHSGRALAADAITWGLFLLLQVAAVLRVAVDLLPGRYDLLAGVALVWCLAVLPWALRYAPVYWRPRADGRPG
jgi:uncharacterized protein involved in response to NO